MSFLDAFSGYNQIKMHPMDEEKTAFMTERSCPILVMTDLPIQKVLKKPDVAGRMVKWAVELSEFDISMSPEVRLRDRSSQTLWSSSRLRQHELKGTTFVGCFQWMDRRTSRVAVLESSWRDPTAC